MAENKNSFLLYLSQRHVFDSLTDKEAGVLIKMLFAYVADENPTPTTKIQKVAFEPIKQQLKRDLIEWEKKRGVRSEAGKAGMEKRWGSRKSITNDNNVINVTDPITKITVDADVDVNVDVRERGNTPHSDFWEKEKDKLHSLDYCMGIALKDDGWIKINKTNVVELKIFNDHLRGTGVTEKTLIDYKKHFHNLKTKSPDKFKQHTGSIAKAVAALKNS